MNHRSSYWETGYFKKKNLRFVFPVNQPGLGDRFIMTSNILYARKEVEHECCIIDIFLKGSHTLTYYIISIHLFLIIVVLHYLSFPQQ